MFCVLALCFNQVKPTRGEEGKGGDLKPIRTLLRTLYMKQTCPANQCSLKDYSGPTPSMPSGWLLVFSTSQGSPGQGLTSK